VFRGPRLLPESRRASYPQRARRLGIEGTVVLLLRVEADGTVARVEVATSSGHEILDRAAAEAAALWRFAPARRDGTAIAYDIRQPVEFTLADA
jgi:protein TonB